MQQLVVLLLFIQAAFILCLNVSYDHRSLLLDGKRRLLLSGSVHYPRATPEMWPEIISKAKQGGLDIIETYVFWDRHEPSPGKYYFEGRFDLVKFVKLVHEAGLFVNLRIGPYVCAEWNLGGFPVWLRDIPGIVFRTDNQPFKEKMQGFLTKIVSMMKDEKLFASQGGPIILAQVENEYGNVDWEYGEAGKRYIQWAAEMAVSQNTGVPWMMCVQRNAPEYILDTCNGMYCDGFTPNSPNKPAMWTESYTGWLTYYGMPLPHRPVEDIAFAVARFFERGGCYHNYYMYFGGTSFGRTTGGPYVASSYDYDAPLDEYGMFRLPKWGHLRGLHATLKLAEDVLMSSDGEQVRGLGQKQEAHVYSSPNGCVAFLANIASSEDASVTFRNQTYLLPAWSVSILLDCKTVAFNTAKVNSETATIAMKKTETGMKWKSFNEPTATGTSQFKAKGLLEQMETTQDRTDYLWYSTTQVVQVTANTSAAISIGSMRDVSHIYVNEELVSSWHTNKSVLYTPLDAPVKLQSGSNKVDILSVTVGLQHFGAFIETWNAGMNGSLIVRGLPTGDLDLTRQEWTYEVGLKGEALRLFTSDGASKVTWAKIAVTRRPLVWYKTVFDAPGGSEPLALDLAGMGKGEAWINGESIGRYWPSYLAAGSACSSECDYRGTYDQDVKCLTGCGEPSQRWYHVPRSWLKPSGNLLVLFEEEGGDPSSIDILKREVNVTCALVSETHPAPISRWNVSVEPELKLHCPRGKHITRVLFASFGNPTGSCGSFQAGSCHIRVDAASKKCIGKKTCCIRLSEVNEPQSSACQDLAIPKSLAVEAVCD